MLVEINKIAISEGLEDLQSVTQDATVIKSNIHYSTNNSLVWDYLSKYRKYLALVIDYLFYKPTSLELQRGRKSIATMTLVLIFSVNLPGIEHCDNNSMFEPENLSLKPETRLRPYYT